MGRFNEFPGQTEDDDESDLNSSEESKSVDTRPIRDETDSPSVSRYISLLKERGHRRTSSAPITVPEQPAVLNAKTKDPDETTEANSVTLRPKQ